MRVSDVKTALGKSVKYGGTQYRLTAYILRRGGNGKLLYQLELSDLKANSVLIAPMERVEECRHELSNAGGQIKVCTPLNARRCPRGLPAGKGGDAG